MITKHNEQTYQEPQSGISETRCTMRYQFTSHEWNGGVVMEWIKNWNEIENQ